MPEISVFSHEICDLGEGPLWSAERASLFWVDINRHLVFEKAFASQERDFDRCWEFDSIPTALATVLNDTNSLWVITDIGLVKLNLVTGEQNVEVPYQLKDGQRTNDAGVGPDKQLWIGTMQCLPALPEGVIFSVSEQGDITHQGDNITIPNTFCWSLNGQYIHVTDSFQGILYKIPFPEAVSSHQEYPWQKSKDTEATYDGGAMDAEDSLWVTRWGLSCVERINKSGETTDRIAVPSQQPSSCCFGGPDGSVLFITSATENLSASEKSEQPDAGKVFMTRTPTTGGGIPAFHLDKGK